MRLVTFETPTVFGKVRRLGAISDRSKHRVIDLQIAYVNLLTSQNVDSREATRVGETLVPSTMEGLILGGRASLEAVKQAVAFAEASEPGDIKGPGGHPGVFDMNTARLVAPLQRPNSLRDFLAFEDHAAAGARRRGEDLVKIWYERPLYYKGNHRSIVGPDEPVARPSFTSELDFEMEIACIVGATGSNLNESSAEAAIFGFTIMNDWSARDVQRAEMAARLGPAKSKDFATSLGPCVITADGFGPQPALQMSAKVNGELVCTANLGDAYWTFAKMISFVSQSETVWATDIYGSGTPFGGCQLDRTAPWLEPGDKVELEVAELGVLRNEIV